jgi:hypothetical protein
MPFTSHQPIESLFGESNRKWWQGTDIEFYKRKPTHKVTAKHPVGNTRYTITSAVICSSIWRYDRQSRERILDQIELLQQRLENISCLSHQKKKNICQPLAVGKSDETKIQNSRIPAQD